MRVLIAGASGDLGTKVAELLVERGDEVFGLTRSQERIADLERRGLQGVVGDLLDARTTSLAVAECGADAVVSVPIDLPERGPLRPRDLETTNELRRIGTRHLLQAATEHGVRRFVCESIVAIYGYGSPPAGLDERSPLATQAPLKSVQPALDAIHELERLVLDATRKGEIEGVVLRLGFYYGADVGSTLFMAKLLKRRMMAVTKNTGAIPWVEISDAARGVVAGLDGGRPGEIYNIVGDASAGLGELADELAHHLGIKPPRRIPTWMMRLGGRYAALMSEVNLHVSNRKAKEELGWSPRFPTVRDGIAHGLPDLRRHL